MEKNGSQRDLVVNLEILEARNVIVKPTRSRDGLFVRYYLSSGNGAGNNNIEVNTREVMATPDPQWKQNFRLDCGVNIDNVNVISELRKQSVRFELRERISKIRVLGSMFRASKLVGWVEIPWKNLLASPTLSINSWFPLIPTTTGASLHLAISLNPQAHLVESVSQAHREHLTEMSCRDDMRIRNIVNVNRRIKRLERDDCRCGRKLCCQGLLEEGIFTSIV